MKISLGMFLGDFPDFSIRQKMVQETPPVSRTGLGFEDDLEKGKTNAIE